MAMKPLVTAAMLAALSVLAAPAQVSLPDYPDVWGVSAPVAGFQGRMLVVGGGCNFPTLDAADGGRKTYYYKTYALGVRTVPYNLNTGWQPLPPLPEPLAYAQCATTPDGRLAVAGGQGPGGAVRSAYVLTTGPDSLYHWHPLPPLPVTVEQGGAACVGRTLYVCGGVQPGGACGLYALDLAAPQRWKRLADCPGGARVQPVMAASGGCVYLMGGYRTEQGRCVMPAEVWCYHPETNSWQEAGSLPPHSGQTAPRGLVGAAAAALPDGRIAVAGGVCDSLFRAAIEGRTGADYLRHPAAWYQFSPDLLLYDPATRGFTTVARMEPLARAGGALLCREGWLFMAVGEVKPGVRTPQVWAWQLSQLVGGAQP